MKVNGVKKKGVEVIMKLFAGKVRWISRRSRFGRQ